MSDKYSSVFEKNGRESIVISESEYKGFDLIDIRTFYVDVAGELAPTRKGITIRAEKLQDFVNTLSAFAQAVEEKGLTEDEVDAKVTAWFSRVWGRPWRFTVSPILTIFLGRGHTKKNRKPQTRDQF